jgi:Ras-related protein Rab-1A
MSFLEYDYLFKILMIGDSGVGKSALLNRYCDDFYTDNYISTIGVDFKVKTIEVNGLRIKLQVWDTAGQERFKSITSSYYRGAQAILCVFDLTDYLTLNNVFIVWIDEIKKQNEKNNSNTEIILVGTKCELQKNEIIENKLKNLEYDYFETSSKKNIGIPQLFEGVVKKLLSVHNMIINKNTMINISSSTSIVKSSHSQFQSKCC